MAYRRKSLPRVLAATLTTALVSMICMLALAPAASARVTIVPGTAQGGGTETFAIRLSNEQSDTSTTRLELTFPADLAIPDVEVARVGKWVATVNMRPVDPPVTVGDREIDEAVASIVWTGGEVAPKQFEQFLVTAGPLPADGRLVFAAAQGYEDGTVDRWTDPAVPGWPGAPTIALIPQAAAPADRAGDTEPGPVGPGNAPAEVTSLPADDGEKSDPTRWALLAFAVLVAAVVAFVGYRFLRPRRPTKRPEQAGAAHRGPLERAGRR